MKRLLCYIFFLLIGIFVLNSCGTDSVAKFQVTISAFPSEAGTVSPASGKYKDGTKLPISASPSAHWKFDHWSGDAQGSSSSMTVTVNKAMNIKANFSKQQYNLTVNREGEGTVDQKVIQTNTNSSRDYDYGTKVQLTANPSDGWTFVKWKGDLSGSKNPATITVKKAKTVTAVFEKKNYPLVVHTSGGGAVNEKVLAAKTTNYKYGTKVQLTANPDKGWKFDKWKGDLSGSENPATITVKEAKTVTAVFKKGNTNSNLFNLGSNGVTIKCPDANFGDSGTVNGVTYTKRRRSQITSRNAAATCTSGITDMSSLFEGMTNFNADISSWDVSNVTDMSQMFDMSTGQRRASKRRLTRIASMQQTAADVRRNSAFNADISNWDVSNVTNMRLMFAGADAFNQSIGSWDVSSVTNMGFMFQKAKSFNKPIEHWNVSNVKNMSGMFNVATSFNQPIDKWNVGHAKKMLGMFAFALSFNQSINSWDVGDVLDMSLMFWGANNFNRSIGDWDVSNVQDMNGMFKEASSFDRPIGSWHVFAVTNMDGMFKDASSFSQDISGWCVPRIPTEPTNFAVNSSLTQTREPQWGTCNAQANGIADARLTQSTQNPDHSVPMVAGRDAALQVFFKIDFPKQNNAYGHRTAYDQQGNGKFNYDVTAKILNRGSLVKKITVSAGTKALLPISTKQAVMNIAVPGQYIKPGLSVKVKTSNGWSYKLKTITVKKVAPFHVNLVPIHVTATGETGDVNVQNKSDYMAAALAMYPINDYNVKVHSALNVSADPTKISQGDFYGKVLSELHSTWVAEGKPDYYYYGVIPQDTVGTIGLGYVDGSQPHNYRQAVGWDRSGWQNRSVTMAHEIGHNMGRDHAPCGDPSGVDTNYPYPNAVIGAYGYDVAKGKLKDPNIYHDLMGYCSPYWISDYTYKGVLKFREEANSSTSINRSARDVLLIWGQIKNNKLILEPAFRIKAPVTMPRESGPYMLSGYDADGSQLFSFSFAGVRVAGLKNTRQFAFTVPVGRVDINKLHSIQLHGRSLKAMQTTTRNGPKAAPMKTTLKPQVAARRVNARTVSIQWGNSQYRMALVKNARTGEVVGFTSNGAANVESNASKLKVYFSDGIRTVAKTVNVR